MVVSTSEAEAAWLVANISPFSGSSISSLQVPRQGCVERGCGECTLTHGSALPGASSPPTHILYSSTVILLGLWAVHLFDYNMKEEFEDAM